MSSSNYLTTLASVIQFLIFKVAVMSCLPLCLSCLQGALQNVSLYSFIHLLNTLLCYYTYQRGAMTGYSIDFHFGITGSCLESGVSMRSGCLCGLTLPDLLAQGQENCRFKPLRYFNIGSPWAEFPFLHCSIAREDVQLAQCVGIKPVKRALEQ